MGFSTRCTLLTTLTLALLSAGSPAADPEPRYDPSTVVTVRVVVAGVREVPKDSPLGGIHLMVRRESSRTDSEPWDVYLGPAEFLKELDFTFHGGDKFDVVGSKIKQGSSVLILAKEIRQNGSALYLRDEKGEPVWKALLKGA